MAPGHLTLDSVTRDHGIAVNDMSEPSVCLLQVVPEGSLLLGDFVWVESELKRISRKLF